MTPPAPLAASALALTLTLTLAGCGNGEDGASSTAQVTAPPAGDQSPSPTTPLGSPMPSSGGTPAAPGSDVTGGDGAEPAPASELSTRIGEEVAFTATLVEVIGVGAVAVTAEQGGADPVLVYGPTAPAGGEVGAGVDVAGTVEVFDAASARERLGQDVVPAGLERFDGTPAVLTA